MLPTPTAPRRRDDDEAPRGLLGWRRAKGQRPWRFFLHHLFGLQLSLFLGFVCLTGSVATLSHEIEWLLWPEVRADAGGTAVSWGTQWDAARAAQPQWALQGIGRGGSDEESYLATVVRARDAAGADARIYVDPTSGRVQGQASGVSFHAFMRGLHYYLFVPSSLMFYAVTSLGVVMLGSLVTGLLVYRKFWRGFLRWPRWDAPPRVVWGDVHRLAGLWSTWFVAVIALTSVWYLLEHAGLDWEQPTPALARPLAPAERVAPDGAAIDRWVAAARRELPGLRVTAVYLPFGARGPVTVQGQRDAWLVRERSNAVFIDPRDGRVLGVRDAQAIGAAERWAHTADPLHFGNFGGLAVKLLWAAFGLLLCALALSGAVIHAKRSVKLVREQRLAAAIAEAREAA
ncbi:MAG TPA: PepSY-associated TM helix domain-containing protein [Methylibium sp.]|nr:PepSY-associated TM helix domain-containing protein [Methylibium sp.]